MAQEDPVLDVCSAYELALFVLSDPLPSEGLLPRRAFLGTSAMNCVLLLLGHSQESRDGDERGGYCDTAMGRWPVRCCHVPCHCG